MVSLIIGLTLVFLALQNTAVYAQTRFLCLTTCGNDGNILGTVDSIGSCCFNNSDRGFETLSDGSIPCQSCADYGMLLGSIRFTFNRKVFMIGEDLTANCRVTTNPSAAATADIEWVGPDGSTLTSGTITSPTAILPLMFSPFQISDFGEYICRAAITSSGRTIFLEGTLTFESPPGSQQPPVDIDGPESFPIAGESYTITCRVNGTASEIQWIGPDGQPIVNSSDITVGNPETAGGFTTSTLMFSSISLGNSGRYECQNDVTTPNTTFFTINVEVPQPTIEIPAIGPPTLGQPYRTNCTGMVPVSLQGSVNVSWFGPNDSLIVSMTGPGSASVCLSFPSFQQSDEGTYTCVITVTSSTFDRSLTRSSTLPIGLQIGVDECALNMDDCDSNAMCVDLPEGFNCVCNDGFTGNGTTCTDVNECTLELDNCDNNARCRNRQGTFRCICNTGFRGNGVNCEDINECALELDNCDNNARCRNRRGTFECICNTGFRGNGVNCEDINECVENTDNCNENAECRNRQGSFECVCDPGFTGNGVNCRDINECALDLDNCDQRQRCVDTRRGRVCAAYEKCKNTVGGFTCICNRGFGRRGRRCRDINECRQELHYCHPMARCRNTPGSFQCYCRGALGYVGDGFNCQCARGRDDTRTRTRTRTRTTGTYNHRGRRSGYRSRTRTTTGRGTGGCAGVD